MKIIDLTQPIYSGMPVYEGDPEVSIELIHTYEQNSWELRHLSMGSHTGTHVDAFSHMDEEGQKLDQIPLDRFFGKAYLVDMDKVYPIGVGLIFEEDVEIDILDKVLEAKPRFVGGSISEPLERALLNNGVITYTRLINLDLLPRDREFMFFGFPLNIKDGDGSPVRAVAIID